MNTYPYGNLNDINHSPANFKVDFNKSEPIL